MIDEELKSYINELIKQGYSINSIRDILIKSGHDSSKIGKITSIVFEETNKDIIDFIDKELKKGKNIVDIKDMLLDLGYDQKKLDQIIVYKKSKASFFDKIRFEEVISQERLWFKSWFKVYIALFVTIIVISLILFLFFFNYELRPSPANFQERMELCTRIDDDLLRITCISYLEGKNSCEELSFDKIHDCEDLYELYSYYVSYQHLNCLNIRNPSLKEYCLQIHERSCNDYFGYGDFCSSIVENKVSFCSNGNSLIGTCIENYYFYSSLSGKRDLCNRLQNDNRKFFCYALT
ncbi:MAG: hypothetical protein ACMXYG_04740 [Candidatus Woesearchaeota archaeon]